MVPCVCYPVHLEPVSFQYFQAFKPCKAYYFAGTAIMLNTVQYVEHCRRHMRAQRFQRRIPADDQLVGVRYKLCHTPAGSKAGVRNFPAFSRFLLTVRLVIYAILSLRGRAVPAKLAAVFAARTFSRAFF